MNIVLLAAVLASAQSMPPLIILASRIERDPAGRSVGRVERTELEKTDSFSLKELMDSVPGVFVKQSNGPRDVSISVRGSGAKTSFAVRNLKMYEDWFPVTQSDGLSRTDLHDPSAYEGIDVFRGPSSALYDNYALGGVVNFRTRRGRDIDGLDVGSAAGSWGYQNHYLHAGKQIGGFEYSAFASVIRGDGYIRHSGFTTVTQNVTLTWVPDDKQVIVVKLLNNDLDAQVPSRLTWSELNSDSRSAGRTTVTGVGVVTPERAAQGRRDRRTIIGARYERAVSPELGWRFMGAYDVKDINQTFGTIGDSINPNFHQYADATYESGRWRHYAGVFVNHMEQENSSFRNLADNEGTRGALQSATRGFHRNVGLRLREEVDFAEAWTAVAGVGLEASKVHGDVQTRTGAETYSRINVDRSFVNAAPELALLWRPSPALQTRARLASGYGIPGISQLTTGADGLAGNNTRLKPQRNVGFELGAGGRAGWLSYDAAAFVERFYNEFVTQSPGSGLSSFTSNAPRSEHRGVELWAEARHPAGPFAAGNYSYNDHEYRTYVEQLGAGDLRDRRGKKIPGVEPHLAGGRVGFSKEGLPGGWLEANHVSSFFLTNGNALKTRGYTVFNANLNWAFKRVKLFVDVRNLLDLTYAASAITVSDAVADPQAYFAGQGRSVSAGVKIHL